MKLLILLSLLAILTACSNVTRADLVLINGNIVTENPKQPGVSAVAVSGDKIIFAGNTIDIKQYTGDKTRVIDLQGKTLIPGFIEGHGHFTGLGISLITLDLTHIKNWDEALSLVEKAVQQSKPGEWIIGRGWHKEKWAQMPEPSVNEYPVHTSLSKVSPDNPVMLRHASGHGCIANAKAMQIAGITKSTPDTTGGIIIRFPNGQPTGIFLETAEELINNQYLRYIASLSAAEQRRLTIRKINAATKECRENGVTTFHDAGSLYSELDLFRELAAKDSLGVRLWTMIASEETLSDSMLQKYRMIGFANNFLTTRAIKQYMDGALGSRGAWMLEPYNDQPDTYGQNVTPLVNIEHVAQLAFKNDYQLCVHAIGDRANRETLDIFEKALQGQTDRRWRVEHAQHLSAQDIPRFARLGVIASYQTVHCTSDGPWVAKRIGDERAEEGAYVWQKVLQTGAHLANGTDCPVERLSPIENYYAAVSRRLNDGSQFYPDQVLSREEALASLTIWNAYAGFEEDIKGSIEPGKLADFAVLSQNILTIPEVEILNTQIELTILAGKVVFENDGF